MLSGKLRKILEYIGKRNNSGAVIHRRFKLTKVFAGVILAVSATLAA
jgi:hypothetical protein